MSKINADVLDEDETLAVVFVISDRKGKEMLYLTMHSTHFIYGYMASDI